MFYAHDFTHPVDSWNIPTQKNNSHDFHRVITHSVVLVILLHMFRWAIYSTFIVKRLLTSRWFANIYCKNGACYECTPFIISLDNVSTILEIFKPRHICRFIAKFRVLCKCKHMYSWFLLFLWYIQYWNAQTVVPVKEHDPLLYEVLAYL